MKLVFQQPHLSIRSFPTITLPPFAIVCGVNGSGKTHLLQAVQNGSISNSIAPVQGPPMDLGPIRLLGNAPIGPEMMMAYTSAPPGAPDMASTFAENRDRALEPHLRALQEAMGVPPGDVIQRNEDVWLLGPAELAKRLRRAGRRFDEGALSKTFEAAERTLTSSSAMPPMLMPWLHPLATAARKLGLSPFAVTEAHLRQMQHWGHSDLFQANMALVFGRYRDARLRNRHLQMRDQDNGTRLAMSNDRFESVFGRPPWAMLNETLEKFGLPYDAAEPAAYDYTSVGLNLRKRSTGETVAISNLSSGERVLFLFALSLYQYDESMINVSRPKVLLLDEMDASLHPEMVYRWLEAIKNGLVEAQGMHCVLTTHSPTTAALAPESALFEMIDGKRGLIKITKQEALNKLTFGVPTLSIDYSGRRQVFVESDTDAQLYEAMYSLIKSHIRLPRELNFISTGMRKKDGGEINSGCAIVKRLVEQLSGSGNRSVFGLVDWDGSAQSTDRIRVLSEGSANGIENILLDPLLVSFLLVKNRKAPEEVSDIATRFTGLGEMTGPDLQRLADSVQCSLDYPSDMFDEDREIVYLGGKSIRVKCAYQEMDDHDLEEKLLLAFPPLNKFGRHRGGLTRAIVDEVIAEYPEFSPRALQEAFTELATLTV